MLRWLLIIAAILFVFWIVGLGTGFLGNWIWVFLVAAFLFWHRALSGAAVAGARPPALRHLR